MSDIHSNPSCVFKGARGLFYSIWRLASLSYHGVKSTRLGPGQSLGLRFLSDAQLYLCIRE